MGTGTKLVITHIATGHTVSFSNFALTEFSDSLSTSWNKQEVYGRMDPIMNYQGTGREISMGVSWKSANSDFMTARHKEITQLMSFQYPTYAETDNAMAIQSPPLLRVSFANLISNNGSDGEDVAAGLICAMDGCAYTPALGSTPEDSPMIRFGGQRAKYNDSLLTTGHNAVILPKSISLKFKLTVLHEDPLGWHYGGGEDGKYGWLGPDNASFGPGFMPSKYSQAAPVPPPTTPTETGDPE
jgi:hypothetical protein|tara:strand:- start:64 stop:789 length:726 start_codon:yes stop_codon:yes gene_type:complete